MQAYLDGRRIAAFTERQGGRVPPHRSTWTVYLATNDIDGALRAVPPAGGTVIRPRHDIGDQGSTAVIRDPAGTACALWQAGEHPGSETAGVPGAPTWAEVTSKDPRTTADFLVRVLGCEPEHIAAYDFVTLYSGGSPVCGVYGGAEERISEGPGAWLPYFVVGDAREAAARAGRNGGKVLEETTDSPYGRWAMLTDPFGAHFAVLEVTARP